MIKLIINGCSGRMGQTVAKQAADSGSFQVVAGIDRFPGALPAGFPVFTSPGECDIPCDVIIDFSRPEALPDLLTYAIEHKTPLVIATTGITPQTQEEIQRAAHYIPVFQSANMSLGVNLAIDLCRRAAAFLREGCDVEIIEKHHTQKLDSPSGTALALANAINGAYLDGKCFTYGRHGTDTRRSKNELGIHAIRGGNIVGEHEALFIAPEEIVSIKHSALTRTVFAAGALRAAEFIATRPAGMYSMQDMLQETSAVTNLYADDDQVLFGLAGLNAADVGTLFDSLRNEGVNVDMITQAASAGTLTLNFTVGRKWADQAEDCLEALGKQYMTRSDDVVKLVVEGDGMQTQAGVAAGFYAALSKANVRPLAVTTSETKISCCVPASERKVAIEALMAEFGL